MAAPVAAAAAGGAGGGGGAGAVLLATVGTLKTLEETFAKFTATIQQFVAAVAPSTVLEFNQSLRDLKATIGSAFVGSMQILSAAVREIGGVLLPAMQKLTPVVNTLTNAFAGVLTGAVRVVSSALQAMTPVLEVVAESYRQFGKLISDVLGIMSAAFKVVGDLMAVFVGGKAGDISDTLKSFADGIRQAVKALVTLVGTLAVFAGFRDTVKSFAVALKKEADERDERAAGLKAVGTGPQISEVIVLAKQQQQASLLAAGGEAVPERSDGEWLREIANTLKATADGESFRQALQKWWGEYIPTTLFGGLIQKISAAWSDIHAFFTRRWW